MIFKPNKSYSILLFVAFIVALALTIIAIVIDYRSLTDYKWLSFSLVIIVFLAFIQAIQTTAATLTMDKNGCTIRLWFYKKAYKWEDLKTIRVEDLRDALLNDYVSGGYDRCIVFSTKSKLRPFLYATPNRQRTFATFYKTFAVYFINNDASHKRRTDNFLWACDEEELLAKLKEWGVEPEYRVYNY